jgi:putative endonuclease
MSKHNETGIKGEQLAEKFLLDKGYTILHRNWRAGKKEVDIIALKEGVVIFVEVKARTGTAFGFPEDAVGHHKQAFLKTAAGAFLDSFPQYTKIQFDIISINFEHSGVGEVVHFEDAFY